MPTLFSPAIIQLILYFAVLAIIIAVAVYVAGLLQAKSVQKELTAEDYLNKFRELNSKGKLSEEEFRIIKKQLAFQIVDEEKIKAQKPFDPATLLARGMNQPANNDNQDIVFSENPDDTHVPGKGTEEADDTIVSKQQPKA